MSSLSAFILGVILQMVTLKTVDVSTPEAVQEVCAQEAKAHLCTISQDMETVVTQASRLPFRGPARLEASAMVLVAIAHHESGFRPGIYDCSLCDGSTARCDHGRSVSIYQMQKSAWQGWDRESVCEDNHIASYLALSWYTRFSGGSAKSSFRSYAGCIPELDCKGGDGLTSDLEKALKKAHIQVNGRHASFLQPPAQARLDNLLASQN